MGKVIIIKDYIIDKEAKLNEDNESDYITERFDDVEIRKNTNINLNNEPKNGKRNLISSKKN